MTNGTLLMIKMVYTHTGSMIAQSDVVQCAVPFLEAINPHGLSTIPVSSCCCHVDMFACCCMSGLAQLLFADT